MLIQTPTSNNTEKLQSIIIENDYFCAVYKIR